MKRIILAGLSIVTVGSAIVFSQPASAPKSMVEGVAPVRSFGPIHPRISPQGDAVAFSFQGAIARMPSTGGVVKRLTDGEGFDIEPAWSPDGKQIAYINSRSFFGGELRLINAEDASSVKLPQQVDVQGKLHFYPDGRRLLGSFQLPGKSAGEGLAWFDLKTGSITPVLDPPQAVRRSGLSQDGKWIAFATNQDVLGQQGGNDGPQGDLWKVSAAGGKPQRIVRFPARIYDVCWSGDSKSVYVTTDLGGAHYDLWKVPLDESLHGSVKLTFGQADEDRPSISLDGRWLLYTDNREGCTALVRRDVANGGEQMVAATGFDFGKPTGSLRVKIIQKGTGEPIVARVSIERKGGKFHAPLGSLFRIERSYAHFYCRENTELGLPAGEYRLRTWRGPEYRSTTHEFQVEAEKATDLSVELERWADLASRGWFSGENHIHANYGYGEWYNTPQTMLDQCEGEDLNVCNFMVANSDGDGVFDRNFFRGQADPLSRLRTVLYWNEEFRSTIWGHMTLVNLRQVVEPVFTGFKDTTNPWDIPTNADIADRTHLQHGLVNYTHAAQNVADPYLGAYTGKGLPIDVALGKIDSLDINNSFPATVPVWYRLLNCGFRVPASAGTDCFLNRIRSRLPGSDRAYVKIDGGFSYKGWIDGLRGGRSFVTNGPMLELTADSKGLGDTIQLRAPQKVRVTARASSQFPLDRVELLNNGKAVVTGKVSGDGHAAIIEQDVPLDRSGWLALAATGPSHADNPVGLSYAYTSPIYIEVKDRPVTARADVEFFLAWIDRLDAAVRDRNRTPSDELRAHVREQLDAARAVYRRIADRSE